MPTMGEATLSTEHRSSGRTQCSGTNVGSGINRVGCVPGYHRLTVIFSLTRNLTSSLRCHIQKTVMIIPILLHLCENSRQEVQNAWHLTDALYIYIFKIFIMFIYFYVYI